MQLQLASALLFTSFLFGGSLLYSSTFAAFLFRNLPANEAGALLRSAFSAYYLWVMATSLVAALLFWTLDPVNAAILASIAAVTVPLRQYLMPQVNAASDAGDSSKFHWLHGLSVTAGLLQILATAYILVRII